MSAPSDADRVRELSRRALFAEVLAEVSREASRAESLAHTLKAIVDVLARHLPVSIASVMLLDEAGTHFTHEVWNGAVDLEAIAPHDPWPVTRGVAGRCARTRSPQNVTDVDADPDYTPGNLLVRSEYLVPIVHRERLHGVLNLESTEPDFFDFEVRHMVDAIADQVAGVIHLVTVVRDLELANARLRELTLRDPLTGIANRRAFDERLDAEWLAALERRRPLALLLVDVDAFKALNDARGHLHGDDCLRAIAACGERALAAQDHLLARYGGEELAVLLPGAALERAIEVAESIRGEVNACAIAHESSPVAPHVTVSVGVSACLPQHGLAPSWLVEQADAALYRAKAAGRDRVHAAGGD